MAGPSVPDGVDEGAALVAVAWEIARHTSSELIRDGYFSDQEALKVVNKFVAVYVSLKKGQTLTKIDEPKDGFGS